MTVQLRTPSLLTHSSLHYQSFTSLLLCLNRCMGLVCIACLWKKNRQFIQTCILYDTVYAFVDSVSLSVDQSPVQYIPKNSLTRDKSFSSIHFYRAPNTDVNLIKKQIAPIPSIVVILSYIMFELRKVIDKRRPRFGGDLRAENPFVSADHRRQQGHAFMHVERRMRIAFSVRDSSSSIHM